MPYGVGRSFQHRPQQNPGPRVSRLQIAETFLEKCELPTACAEAFEARKVLHTSCLSFGKGNKGTFHWPELFSGLNTLLRVKRSRFYEFNCAGGHFGL